MVRFSGCYGSIFNLAILEIISCNQAFAVTRSEGPLIAQPFKR